MKRVGLLLMLFAFLFLSCGGKTEKKCSPECGDLKVCIEGECKFKTGKCEENKDCSDGKICNKSRNACVEDTESCSATNPEGTCPDANATCKSGSCECKENYELKDGACTLKESAKCSVANPKGKCQDHATCKVEGTKASCECDESFKPGPDNTCVKDTNACNNCAVCEKCENGECVPDGSGYQCTGDFNHRCRPMRFKGDTRETGCKSGYFCNPDPDEETVSGGYPKNQDALGYCTTRCANKVSDATDEVCNSANYAGRNQDKFICLVNTDKYNYCEKVKSNCQAKDLRKGNPGDDCSKPGLTCGADAYCKIENICVYGKCSEKCSPADDKCGENGERRTCSGDLWSNPSDPLHRCLSNICKNDSECTEALTGKEKQACNSFFLKKDQDFLSDPKTNGDLISTMCFDEKGEKGFNEECSRAENAAFSDKCKSGLCLGSGNSPTGECAQICSKSSDCGDSHFCYLYSLFSDTKAGLPLCVDDSWFQGLEYKGECSQAGGCPAGSVCSPIKIKQYPRVDEDLEYLCLGPVSGTKNSGDSCASAEECKSGFCVNPADTASGTGRVCVDFCASDNNCSNGQKCNGHVKLKPAFDAGYKYCKNSQE